MMRVAFAVVVFTLCALPTFARAEQTSDPNYCSQGEDCTEYFMENEVVDGELVSPNGEQLTAGGRIRHVPLIRTRAHFIDLMLKSAENL